MADLARVPHRASRPQGGGYLAPTWCPECGASLRHLAPMPAQVVAAATVVAQRTVGGSTATAAEVAAALGSPRRPLSRSATGHLLARAAALGLVGRSRLALPKGGGQYLYVAAPKLAAYVQAEALGRDLRSSLAALASGAATLGAQVRWPG